MPPGEWDWLIAALIEPLRGLLLSDVRSWFVDPIRDLLAPLWSVRDYIFGLGGQFQSAIAVLTHGVREKFDSLRDSLWSSILNAVIPLVAPSWDAATGLRTLPGAILQGLLSPLWDASGATWSLPGSLLHGLLGPMWDSSGGIWALPGNLLAGLLSPLWDTSGATWSLPGALGGMVSDPLWSYLPALGPLAAGIGGIPAALVMAVATYLLQNRDDQVALQDRLSDMLDGLAQRTIDKIGPLATGALPGQLQGVGHFITSGLESGLDTVLDLVLGRGEILPEDAPGIGVRAFLTTSALGVGAHLTATLIDLVHPLRMIGLHYLSGFMADMGGFSSVTTAIMGTTMRVGVAQPMQYHLQARTRAVIPTTGDLQALHRKHTLNEAEFGRYMAYQGYNKWWIDRFIEYLPADPRLYEILRMADAGFPETDPPSAALPTLQRMGIRASGNPNWWLQLKFALAGYNWVDIPVLVDVTRRRLTNSERLRLVATTSLMFRNGYMAEGQYRAELAAAGKTPAQVDWRVKAERWAALKDDIDDFTRLFTDQYLKDVITEADLRVALVSVGVTQHKADILTNRAAIRKLPKPTDPTKAEEERATRAFQTKAGQLYREQYRSDLITAGEFEQSLRAIGIRADLAWATVELERTRRLAETQRVAIQEADRAETRIQTARERQYREQYRAGEIDQAAYQGALVAAGQLPAEAAATVSAEATRRRALEREAEDARIAAEAQRTRSAYERLFRTQYRAGQIGSPEYHQLLESVGLSTAEAAAVVANEYTLRQADLEAVERAEAERTAEAARRARAALLREQFEAGDIDPDRYLAGLLGIGWAPDLARATVDLAYFTRWDALRRAEAREQERQEAEIQRESARLYLRRYRAGEIDDRQLLEALVQLGIPEPLARTTQQLEVLERREDAERVLAQLIIPALKAPWQLYVKQLRVALEAGEIGAGEYLQALIGSGVARDIADLILEFS